MSSTTFTDNTTTIVADWLNDVNACVYSPKTVAEMLLLNSLDDGARVHLLGYYAAGDGGGQPLYYDASSTATHNGGTVFQPTGVTIGRLLSVDTSVINVKQFGVVGDFDSGSGTDDTVAIQAAVNFQTTAKITGARLFWPAGGYLITATITIPATSGGIVWDGSGAYSSNPYTTSRLGPQTILYWGGAAGGTMIQSTSTLGHAISNMTLVGRQSAAANRAGILIHSKWQAGFANAHVHLTNVTCYDAAVAIQFADLSTDGNSSDSLFDMLTIFSCDTGLLVKNTQGLNFIFNLYGVDDCRRAVHFEEGGSLTINGVNLSNSGGTGSDEWCFKFDNFGDSSGNAQINNCRIEQNTQQILQAANLGSVQINGMYEAQADQNVTMFDLNGVSLTMRDSRLITNDTTNPCFMLEYGGGSQMPALVIEDSHLDVAAWVQNDWFGFDVNDRTSLFVNRCVYTDTRRTSVPFINSIPENGRVTHFVQTTDANITNVTLNGESGNAYNYMQIPTDTAWIADVYIVGKQLDGSVVGTFHRRASLKNIAGTTTQIGTTQTIGTDENAGGWSVALNVNDALDILRAQVTGLTSTTIDWKVAFDMKEVF